MKQKKKWEFKTLNKLPKKEVLKKKQAIQHFLKVNALMTALMMQEVEDKKRALSHLNMREKNWVSSPQFMPTYRLYYYL